VGIVFVDYTRNMTKENKQYYAVIMEYGYNVYSVTDFKNATRIQNKKSVALVQNLPIYKKFKETKPKYEGNKFFIENLAFVLIVYVSNASCFTSYKTRNKTS